MATRKSAIGRILRPSNRRLASPLASLSPLLRGTYAGVLSTWSKDHVSGVSAPETGQSIRILCNSRCYNCGGPTVPCRGAEHADQRTGGACDRRRNLPLLLPARDNGPHAQTDDQCPGRQGAGL